MGWLADLLKEYPALSVARERLALFEERLDEAERQNEKLRRELETVQSERDALLENVKKTQKSERFMEHQGVCWQINEGEVDPLAYCPECHLAMHEFPPNSNETLACSKCNFVAPFAPSEINNVAKSLEVRLLTL